MVYLIAQNDFQLSMSNFFIGDCKHSSEFNFEPLSASMFSSFEAIIDVSLLYFFQVFGGWHHYYLRHELCCSRKSNFQGRKIVQ